MSDQAVATQNATTEPASSASMDPWQSFSSKRPVGKYVYRLVDEPSDALEEALAVARNELWRVCEAIWVLPKEKQAAVADAFLEDIGQECFAENMAKVITDALLRGVKHHAEQA